MVCPFTMETSRIYLTQSSQLLKGILEAPDESSRINVLKLAHLSFDHFNTVMHDAEVRSGAVDMISRCLCRSSSTDELLSLCQLLEFVFRCSDAAAVAAINECAVVLFPILIRTSSDTDYSDELREKASKLLDRSYPLRISLLRVQDNDILLLTIHRCIRNGAANCQERSLTVLEHLTKHEDSKYIVARQPGILDTILQTKDCEIQVASILRNLAWESRNRSPIVMAKGSIDMLVALMTSKQTHLMACCALEYLSAEASLVDRLVSVNDPRLLDRLEFLIANENTDTTIAATKVLSNLVCSSTAKQIGARIKLVRELGRMASKQNPDRASVVAAQAIKRVSMYVKTNHSAHETLLDSLINMSSSCEYDIQLWTARGFVEQCLKVSNGFFVVRSSSAMAALLKLANSNFTTVQVLAMNAIANLAEQSSNGSRLSSNKDILDVLVQSIGATGHNGHEVCEDARRQAVRAILCMSNNSKKAMKRIAKHTMVIQSLARFGTSVDGDIELKQAALHGILIMAPSM